MRVFVINLESSVDRMKAAAAQLTTLRVPYERFPAVYGAGLPPVERKAALSWRWWCATGRPVRLGEIGCWFSHTNICRKMVEEQIPLACVLEDDAKLAANLRYNLERVEAIANPQESAVYLLSNWTNVACETEEIRPSLQAWSAEAYVLTLAGAKAILKVNDPMRVPCDCWQYFARFGGVKVFNVFPVSCLKNEFCFGSLSSAGAGKQTKDWPWWKVLPFKAWRAAGTLVDRILR